MPFRRDGVSGTAIRQLLLNWLVAFAALEDRYRAVTQIGDDQAISPSL